MVGSTLDMTSKSIQSVLDNPGRISVINQSMGVTKAGIVDELWRAREARASAPEEIRGNRPASLAEELGLPKNASDKQVLEALNKRVDEVWGKSETIRASMERYHKLSEELEKRGIVHVLATGNDRNKTVAEMERLGIRLGEDFTRSALTTDKTINVGASTGGIPDRVAPFSNGGKHVSLVMDGTDIPVSSKGEKQDGTSFSAPQVTAVIADMRRMDPTLPNDQVRDILKRASKDTSEPARLEGAGILDQVSGLTGAEVAHRARTSQ